MFPLRPPHFEAALRDVNAKQAQFRCAAASSLASPPPGEEVRAARALEQLARDPVGPVRRSAVEALGALRNPASFPTLSALADDPDHNVRQTAVTALGMLGSPDARRRVCDLLEHPQPEVRYQAVAALPYLAVDDAAPLLRERLSDPDREVRAVTADVASVMGCGELAGEIAALLEEPDEDLRRTAALALATLGDARGAAHLRAALSSPAWALVAAEALGKLGDSESLPALAQVVERRFAPLLLQAAAAAALVRLGDPRGVPGLRRVLRAWRADGRDYAVRAVGELQIGTLTDELHTLARRPRGADLVVIRDALDKLSCAASPTARLSRLEPASAEQSQRSSPGEARVSPRRATGA